MGYVYYAFVFLVTCAVVTFVVGLLIAIIIRGLS